jgi:hypothetical protein
MDTMNQTNTVMLGIFIALGVVLVAGLVVIPIIHEAQARSLTATLNNKGQQGDSASGGKRHGVGGGCDGCGG